ncbi:hypothetical protein HZ326_0597 [Fusarium oxysporum f. sp. albedinis]|nr:hypothetical protein HZ326_0597 [Fusarium oxysporum f. sp. albedinis]
MAHSKGNLERITGMNLVPDWKWQYAPISRRLADSCPTLPFYPQPRACYPRLCSQALHIRSDSLNSLTEMLIDIELLSCVIVIDPILSSVVTRLDLMIGKFRRSMHTLE